jgi:16S rRNA (cytosine1407-C5)-methyltransferase
VRRESDAGGRAGFEAFYAAIYGQRWESLAAALAQSGPQVGLRVKQGGGYELFAAAAPEAAILEAAGPGNAGPSADACQPYFLDPASVAAAAALDLPSLGQVLDACAAPGGKSLVLASRLPEGVRLLANELSADRRRRLGLVLDASLPRSIRERVSIFGADAAALCRRRPAAFQAILLDAPCSSERHVLADRAALAAWTPARPSSLAGRQWALLSSAFLMLAPGGCLLYSTCSINPGENDGVVARLLKKYGGQFEILAADLPGSEPTDYGSIILPDSSGGIGPMYVFKAKKA